MTGFRLLEPELTGPGLMTLGSTDSQLPDSEMPDSLLEAGCQFAPFSTRQHAYAAC